MRPTRASGGGPPRSGGKPSSAVVGTSAMKECRALLAIASARSFPDLICGKHSGSAAARAVRRKASAANVGTPSPSMGEGWDGRESVSDMPTKDFTPITLILVKGEESLLSASSRRTCEPLALKTRVVQCRPVVCSRRRGARIARIPDQVRDDDSIAACCRPTRLFPPFAIDGDGRLP